MLSFLAQKIQIRIMNGCLYIGHTNLRVDDYYYYYCCCFFFTMFHQQSKQFNWRFASIGVAGTHLLLLTQNNKKKNMENLFESAVRNCPSHTEHNMQTKLRSNRSCIVYTLLYNAQNFFITHFFSTETRHC